MLKYYFILFLTSLSCVCLAQTNDVCYGNLLTRIIREGKVANTSQLLYCRNTRGDSLSVYLVAEGVVSEASIFYFTEIPDGLYLYNISMLSSQQMNDSLRIDFQDVTHTVAINRKDSYVLFPGYYKELKQDVKVKHSVMAILNLLSDNLGDYPISITLPLLSYTPQFDKQIQKAKVLTIRSQSDLTDTWTCNYLYNNDNLLDSVSEVSTEEIRFHKKIRYINSKPASISTYLNIEDRQVTERKIDYKNHRNTLIWQEQVDESGKNRQTILSVSLTWRDLGQLQKMKLTTTEVFQLLKSAHPATKHTD
jgi:hypothetical protein